ncbi:3-dehydroquinate synthase [Helicobacter sp. MIT 14-3879]|uniref:3-dehydroquinate synthase n=1 Tax=Helicobacter sp. MIT 14-3879 TaxID=2040649 RepID=UPI000E1E3DDD|nr:3-dehydroquinate synthase [Helicobacter sp. MIT 14-3879]RDU62434.1 3-dehydroquinate synthase [Helicobacter sp. MIT 14-3879]
MKIIKIDLQDRSYNVYLGNIDSNLNEIHHNKVLIVTNPRVSALHISSLLSKFHSKQVFICTLKDGEIYKNMQSVEEILNNAFIHKLDRKSLIIGFGGGVIGDMAGFAAGIYQRGIDFINIPTTLLSQVDASIGGKTGINTPFGKNLIGLFYQPKAVYIDVNFLSTLNKREFISGLSEIVKVAVCFDRNFFEWLENADLLNNKDNLTYAIQRSIEIKADVISKDEREDSVRAGLNYGHTFGHIIELLGNYSTYLHGEAISMGIIKANKLALELNRITKKESSRIENLLLSFGLPISYEVNNKDEFYNNFYLDKKSQNDKLRFIIPNGIGKMEILENPSKELLLSIL